MGTWMSLKDRWTLATDQPNDGLKGKLAVESQTGPVATKVRLGLGRRLPKQKENVPKEDSVHKLCILGATGPRPPLAGAQSRLLAGL